MKVNLATLQSVASAAELLKVGTTTVKTYIRDKRLAAVLVGGALVIPLESIQRLQNRNAAAKKYLAKSV